MIPALQRPSPALADFDAAVVVRSAERYSNLPINAMET
jgi:hypothetical protein